MLSRFNTGMSLMANSNNQGNGSEVVKESTKAALGDGLVFNVLANSGNIEAMKELMDLSVVAVQETARIKELEEVKMNPLIYRSE